MPCEMSLVKHIGKQEVAACKCYKNFLDTDNFHKNWDQLLNSYQKRNMNKIKVKARLNLLNWHVQVTISLHSKYDWPIWLNWEMDQIMKT